MVDQFLDCIPVDGYIFRVHLVSFNFLAFHRLKSSCPYVQCQFLKVYAFFLQCFQYSRGEMQSGSRCGYRTFYFGVNSLICFLVAFLRIPVQIGWDRKLSEHFEDIGESYFGVIPCEVYPMAGTFAFSSRCCQSNRKAFDGHFPFQCPVLPFLQIADHAEPCGVFRLLEVQYIIIGLNRFETEYLNQCTCFFAEVKARLDDFCIVEYH